MNMGKIWRICLKWLVLTVRPEGSPVILERQIANATVIGIIISVLVSLTMTAYEVAAGEKIDAAATTEDMSFTAVPAHRPNACGASDIRCPRVGNVSTAKILKVKIVAMA